MHIQKNAAQLRSRQEEAVPAEIRKIARWQSPGGGELLLLLWYWMQLYKVGGALGPRLQ